MMPKDVANDELLDYTRTLEFLAHHMLAPGCQVRLRPQQFEVLKAYLSHLQNMGDAVNFQLEMCVDHNPGYSVSWDNDGSRHEDDLVDTIMEDLVQNLGFYGASIKNEGHLIDLADIDARIADIRARVAAKHNI
ncbi:hypothetical protein [Rhizobium giardinii]|uniref:hypothetical protein n=1 Tax=Rhizobium giardinii TaxID=56731 RepID=UPI003D6FF6B5